MNNRTDEGSADAAAYAGNVQATDEGAQSERERSARLISEARAIAVAEAAHFSESRWLRLMAAIAKWRGKP
jgi:hypothetical protein